MRVEYLTGDAARAQIQETFHKLRSLIAPTMGARGQFAVLDQDMGQPILTDDGVTVGTALRDLGGYDRTVGKPFLEACRMTEKTALDGTTLTAILIDELYTEGFKMITEGVHPQVASDRIDQDVSKALKILEGMKLKMRPEWVEDVATIATKIPQMGDIVKKCYELVGEDMNIYVEWKPGSYAYDVIKEEGMQLDSGYMIESFNSGFNSYKKAKIALLKTGLESEDIISKWFESFPAKKELLPIVYVVKPSTNPNVIRRIVDTHNENDLLDYQFIFLNASNVDDLYLDIAAMTGAEIQSPETGKREYTYQDCGEATNITIEITKSSMTGTGDVSKRVKYYKEVLEKSKFGDSDHSRWLIQKSLAALTTGIARVRLGVPTEAEFVPLRLKLDDAIGAVEKSFKHGVLIGAGKALYNVSDEVRYIKGALRVPNEQIMTNAGIMEATPVEENEAYNVITRKKVDLIKEGILDSYESVHQALRNASSIATTYLKVYMIAKRLEKKEAN